MTMKKNTIKCKEIILGCWTITTNETGDLVFLKEGHPQMILNSNLTNDSSDSEDDKPKKKKEST